MKPYRFLVGEPEEKRPLRRAMHKWKINDKMDVKEIRWGDMDCINLFQDSDQWKALVNAVMNLRVP
jgi:hypothetical protein